MPTLALKGYLYNKSVDEMFAVLDGGGFGMVSLPDNFGDGYVLPPSVRLFISPASCGSRLGSMASGAREDSQWCGNTNILVGGSAGVPRQTLTPPFTAVLVIMSIALYWNQQPHRL